MMECYRQLEIHRTSFASLGSPVQSQMCKRKTPERQKSVFSLRPGETRCCWHVAAGSSSEMLLSRASMTLWVTGLEKKTHKKKKNTKKTQRSNQATGSKTLESMWKVKVMLYLLTNGIHLINQVFVWGDCNFYIVGCHWTIRRKDKKIPPFLFVLMTWAFLTRSWN